MKKNSKGFILAVVLCIGVLLMIIVGSLFELITTQRKLSVRKEVLLQADNAAETAIDYAYSCIINDINANTIRNATSVPTTGYKEFTFASGVNTYLTGDPTMNTGYTGQVSNMSYADRSVRILPAGTNKRFFVSSADPANAGSPVMNQWVNQRLVPVIARVTATESGKSYTAYVQKSIASQEISLFQYSIFFQGQLHMHRGFRPMGDVHTNGMLFLNAQNGDLATYNGAVSATGHIYRGSTFDQSGTGSDAYGYVPVNSAGDADFDSTSPVVNPSQTGTTSPHLQILVANTTTYAQFGANKDWKNAPSTWKQWAKDTFAGNLQDKSHDVPPITLVGADGYRQDVASTTGTDSNEFNNGPYKLIEPTFPSDSTYNGVRMNDNSNNVEANASLILRIEYNDGPVVAGATVADTDPAANTAKIFLHQSENGAAVEIRNGKVYVAATTGTSPDAAGSRPVLSKYSDPWRMFVLKGYRVKIGWDPTDKTLKDVHDYVGAITLPDKVFGVATADVSSVAATADLNLKMEDFDVALSSGGSGSYALASTMTTPLAALSSTNLAKIESGNQVVQITKGLFDSRLGRGVVPLTVDIDALKDILEAPVANFTNPSNNLTFRTDFNPTAGNTATYKKWNGLIYIEFPTSLTIDPAVTTTNSKNDIFTRQFAYSSTPEYLHPDRAAPTDSRANRTDKIVPIAPELRRYPAASSASLNSTILDAQYAIPAVQLINGRSLPHPNSTDDEEGFTIATNAPVYVLGNYNSDGDYSTGSNTASDTPATYAQAETDPVEIPAAIFCDTFTVLSNGWGLGGTASSNRANSFYGANNGSTASNTAPGKVSAPTGRPAKSLTSAQHPTAWHFATNSDYTFPPSNPASGAPAKPYVEISACVATGEYPIFEFFTHALENYQPMYNAMSTTKANPIVFKGSLVGMFHSEIQHIKQAYGRNVGTDIQSYWQQHGAFAIAGTRFHQLLVDGKFPPGTPKAYLTSQKEFTLLRWSDPADAAVLTSAGFTAP